MLREANSLSAAHAQGGPRDVRSGPTDVHEVEAFLDGLMSSLMREHRSAGAVVSVVKDGRVLFQRGYGFAAAVVSFCTLLWQLSVWKIWPW